jgi:myb proto-oncogene protein
MKLTQDKDSSPDLLSLMQNSNLLLLASEVNKTDKIKHHKYWTLEDDEKLSRIAKENNYDWKKVAEEFQGRSVSDVEQRWRHRIDPSTRKTAWTKEEDQILLMMHKRFGGKWKIIANYLPGRLSSSVKNRFYGKLFKQQPKQPKAISQKEHSMIEEDDELMIESLLDLSDNESVSSGSTSCMSHSYL